MTFDPNLVLFYVSNIENSTHFYSELLNVQPIHTEPDYAMFLLKPGLRLGLWSQNSVKPAPTIFGGGSEFAIQVVDEQTIDELFENYQNKNFRMIQEPTNMDFGYTFVTCDPDDHRIRFFSKK
ncbi:bleomycin resistance protein [Legionella gratiana]|uniref:Bleomycin resistance protein n=1 Tax=Legionella gratiana TaxID=45066 RepID=A0A378J844_9GAMM|nr:VOC family protein [Legionella gratiana]KTD10804.1 bleomycin resistance protein [Legionella gratiana]STX43974.1 glyoxalase family protein superfamily [Legionella gratiana]